MKADLWQWFAEHGVRLADPRPAFAPSVEEQLQGTLEAAVAKGRSLPEPAQALPAQIRLLHLGPGRCLLYAVPSIAPSGFWGVGVAEVHHLSQQPLPWGLVLLQTSCPAGVWLPDQEILRRAPVWRRVLPNGPTYELTPEDLNRLPVFHHYPELLELLERHLSPPL